MNKTILFAVLCALFVATAVASSDFAAENQAMWLKYRYHLVHHLSRHFCAVNGQGHPCPLMDSTVFQMVDEPRDALWHRSKFYLNEDVAKFVPAWKTTFEPQCTGVDCAITTVYEKMLKSFPNAGEGAQAFVSYMRAPTESYADKGVSKSYPWNESGETLQNFVNQMQGKADYGWSFSIDRNTPQQNSYPWGLKEPIVVADKSFVRKINNNGAVTAMSDFFFVKKNNTKAVAKVEAEEESDEVEDQTLSAAEFLFRRRRSAPPPPAPVPIQQIIKTNHFAISFFAKDIRAINIVPGTWFNHDLLRRYGPQLSGWWGSAGKLSLLPRTVYVAYQPKVEIVVSESQLGGVKQQLDQTGVLAWLVGGIHFKGYNTHAMSDEDAFADRVYIEEVASESEKRELTEVEKKQLTRKSVLSGNDELASEQQHEEQADKVEDQTMSAADFLFRRRRRAPPPPPPPPPPPKLERNFKIVFESNSPSPQILGVVSTVLPA